MAPKKKPAKRTPRTAKTVDGVDRNPNFTKDLGKHVERKGVERKGFVATYSRGLEIVMQTLAAERAADARRQARLAAGKPTLTAAMRTANSRLPSRRHPRHHGTPS